MQSQKVGNLPKESGDPAHLSSRLHGAGFNVSAAAADGPPEQRNNLLLHEALRSLFACSPLFHTQTLTLEGFPVPSVCCSSQNDASTAAGAAERHGRCSLAPPSSLTPWKRLKEMQPVRESKRRKSSSWWENSQLPVEPFYVLRDLEVFQRCWWEILCIYVKPFAVYSCTRSMMDNKIFYNFLQV